MDQDELLKRISRDLVDSYDEELEMEIENISIFFCLSHTNKVGIV